MFQTIGTDIEVFGRKANGQHVALCGLIGGTKEEPMQIEGLDPGYALQEDNVSLEFNIPPAQTKDQWLTSLSVMRREVYHTLRHLSLEVSPNASVSFDVEELTHPKALEFGCEPDFNAWTMKENQRPKATNKALRTCGGHIHVGSDIPMVRGVQLMDLHLGVPSVLVDDNPAAVARRELYGKGGAMRPKPYGWEYRVLSNFWFFNKELCAWVFDVTRNITHYLDNQKAISEKAGQSIQACINNSDKKLAAKICVDYDIYVPSNSF